MSEMRFGVGREQSPQSDAPSATATSSSTGSLPAGVTAPTARASAGKSSHSSCLLLASCSGENVFAC
eukprot:16566-Heterococcus_DN1.PRE.1